MSSEVAKMTNGTSTPTALTSKNKGRKREQEEGRPNADLGKSKSCFQNPSDFKKIWWIRRRKQQLFGNYGTNAKKSTALGSRPLPAQYKEMNKHTNRQKCWWSETWTTHQVFWVPKSPCWYKERDGLDRQSFNSVFEQLNWHTTHWTLQTIKEIRNTST